MEGSVLETYSPPTLTGVGHQWTDGINGGCNQWLSLAKLALEVPHAGRNRSLVARSNRCGECIKTSTFKPCHLICQLGLGLDSVGGVKAVYLEPTF